ncbi:response regulator [Celeribacter halophilus]|jgi:DNA-binding response OmpR family regulator|uniref:Response regulator n=1 Tax=Celeribacter halophilus TaxID=576117 RepID=A0AAW7XSF2_9RHOB|nr:response regulator [Celeribacter halophilus]MDO6456199.1 response regulator [Celeribacter halophilus]MDO6723389.1 response regulator [Celeribacter halophilus]
MKVLFVDDEADIREMIEIALMVEEDIDATFASGGAEAIEILKAETFDAILLDVMMLPPDGEEVLRTARSLPAHNTTKIVMCTAKTSQETEQELKAMGADRVLHKPFKPVKLAGYLRQLLGTE